MTLNEQLDSIIEKLGGESHLTLKTGKMNEIITLKGGTVPEGDNLISSKLNVMIGLVGGTVPEDGLVTSKLKTILTSLGGDPESMTDGLLSDYLTLIEDLVQDAGLPAGYEELEYVENSKGQNDTYIVLNHKFNSAKSKITIDYQCISFSGRSVFGNGSGSYGKALNISNGGYYFGAYINPNNTLGAMSGIHHLELGNNQLLFDGELKQEFTMNETVSVYDLYIGQNCKNDGTPSTNKAMNKIGKVKLEHDGVVLFDLVPCKNPEGIVGFYDMINKEFRRSESGYDWE